ncbi:response regulator [Haloplanus sp. GCM10025708]|uniref:response regulator n=1 Tax=Haloferacaceae TaxID=1644056 RepID=UPI003621446D
MDRVLVVDDEADVAETTAMMLADRGLEPVWVAGPRAALDELAGSGRSIGCVVSDYKMPEMDGLELLERVRERRPGLPYLLFTGRGSEEVASRAITAGADGYLQKGTSEQYDRLANRVEALLDQVHTRRELDKRDQQFRAIFENAYDGIFILDLEDAVIVDANPRACELLEYPYDELVGTSIGEIHPDDYEEYLEVGKSILETRTAKRVESVCYTRDGDTIRSDITAAPMAYGGQTYLLTIMRPRKQ